MKILIWLAVAPFFAALCIASICGAVIFLACSFMQWASTKFFNQPDTGVI